jgi:hypothetical protein
MVDVSALAGAGATAILAAMATDAWLWARAEVSKLLGRNNGAREREEIARLDGFADDLSAAAERDVHNRLHGYLEARLGDDAYLREQFLTLIQKICVEVGIEPGQLTAQLVNASNSIVVQTAGGNAHVQVVSAVAPVVRWAAMTGPEAARRIESMSAAAAIEALAEMEPALAARRLSHVRLEWARDLLTHMDEGLAADLLAKMTVPEHAANLLAGIEPARAAAILDLAIADWTVARLVEMDPDRALVLFAEMGAKRTENLLAAMERQHAVRLLSAIRDVLPDQARTFDLAQQEAERIRAEARRQAQETIDKASAEAEAIKANAERELAELRSAARREARRATPGSHRRSRNGTAPDDHRRPPNGSTPVFVSHAASRPNTPSQANTQVLDEPLMTLPTELFLISHGGDGRPRLDQAMLETAVAGAALCELVRAGLVAVDEGCAIPTGAVRRDDTIVDFVLRSLGGDPQPISAWTRTVRRELFLLLAQRLADDGTVLPMKSRVWARAPVYYKPTDEAIAKEPAVRVVRHLIGASEVPDERTYLLAALVEIAEIHAELPVDLRRRQVRELMAGLLRSRTLPTDLRTILDGVDSAIASIALIPRSVR